MAQEFHTRRMAAISTRFEPKIQNNRNLNGDAVAAWEAIYGEEDRQPRYSSALFYWPFLVALAICEVPVNRLSFELFFQESPVISLGVSFLIGSLFMGLAHGVGIVARRFRYNAKRGGAGVACGQLLLTIALIGALAYGVAVLRQGYLAFVTQPNRDFSQLMESNQYGEAALLVLKVGLGIEGWIFLFINLAIVFVGVLAAYFCHDPHPDFQKADETKKKTELALNKLNAQKGEAEASEQRRFAVVMRRLGA